MIRKVWRRRLAIIVYFAAAATAFVTLVVLTLLEIAEQFPGDWDPP